MCHIRPYIGVVWDPTIIGPRGERPPYWTAVVQPTYDQKKALGSLFIFYRKLRCVQISNGLSLVSTMRNWLKTGRTASQPLVFDDTCDILYLDEHRVTSDGALRARWK